MPHFADSPWWRAVFFDQVGASFLGGVVAFGFALVVLRITRSREERAANLQTSRQVAGELSAALLDLNEWAIDPAGHEAAMRTWMRLSALQAPMLADLELFGRINEMTDQLLAYQAWLDRRPLDEGPAAAQWRAEGEAKFAALSAWIEWEIHGLAAHRRTEDVPYPPRPAPPPVADAVPATA